MLTVFNVEKVRASKLHNSFLCRKKGNTQPRGIDAILHCHLTEKQIVPFYFSAEAHNIGQITAKHSTTTHHYEAI